MVAITSVLLPLYIYPIAGPSTWSEIFTSISANPDLHFGPGLPPFPNPEYIDSIAKLNTYENTNLLGYVHTSYGARPIADVKADIAIYDDWAQYTAADITLAGIFFDETVAIYNATDYAYLSTAATFARSSGFETIILNPGTIPDTRYYALASQILAFENAASAYTSSVLAAIPTQYLAKTSFMFYGFSGTEAEQNTLVQNLKTKGLGGLFISTQSVYSAVSTLWAQFTRDLTPV